MKPILEDTLYVFNSNMKLNTLPERPHHANRLKIMKGKESLGTVPMYASARSYNELKKNSEFTKETKEYIPIIIACSVFCNDLIDDYIKAKKETSALSRGLKTQIENEFDKIFDKYDKSTEASIERDVDKFIDNKKRGK